MNEDELKLAVAEVAGVTCRRCSGTGKYMRYGSHDWFHLGRGQKQRPVACDHLTWEGSYLYAMLPNFTGSRDTIMPLIEKLNEGQQDKFIKELIKTRGHDAFYVLVTTPVELCRAYLSAMK